MRSNRIPALSLSVALLACGAVALPFQSKGKGKDDELNEAEKLLRVNAEDSVRKGARACLDLNSVKSIELLFDVLRGAQPHYRDIAWEVLPKFSDRYARHAVEKELRTNAKDAEVRQWCAELLGLYGDSTFGPAVEKALADRDLGVRRAAARALGQLKWAGGVKALEKAAADRDLVLRANSIEALSRIDPVAHQAKFFAGLEDADGGVRCALLGALPEIYPELAPDRSVAALADRDWRPRLQAVENLARRQTKEAVDALVRASADPRPVVKRKAMEALHGITGFEGTKPEDWSTWWSEHREGFHFPELRTGARQGEPKGTFVTYHDIPVLSDRVAFLIDASQGMAARLKDGRVKARAAIEELETVFASLEGKIEFNLFTWADEAEPFQPKAVPLDEKTKKGALAFVGRASNAGQKNIWGVLSGVVDDPALDTLYLLSSGEPEVGLYVHWNRVTEHLRDLNRFHKVVVHTVAYSESQWYREQLEKIAEATGGKFTWFE